MDKKVKNLSFTSICLSNNDHLVLKRRLSEDPDFTNYVYKNIDKYFLEPNNDNGKLQENTSYLVKKDDELVGFVHICKRMIDTISFHYAVIPSFRGKGIGTAILKEVPILIFEDIDPELCVNLKINMYNFVSQKAALRASYVNLGRKDKDYIFETTKNKR